MGNKVVCRKSDCTNYYGKGRVGFCRALTCGYGDKPCAFYKKKGEMPMQTINRIKREMEWK